MNVKKLIVSCLLSIGIVNSITAVNKQQIHLSNQSHDASANQEILVHMTWKYGGQLRYSDVILKAHRDDLMVKAPISGYKLFSIDVTPAINLASLAAGLPIIGAVAPAAGIAYGVTHSLNHHTIRSHGNKFFIVDTEDKKSQIASQKQVRIHGYKTQEEFNKIIGKDQATQSQENKESTDENQE